MQKKTFFFASLEQITEPFMGSCLKRGQHFIFVIIYLLQNLFLNIYFIIYFILYLYNIYFLYSVSKIATV